MPRGDLKGLVDVVDREGDTMHADLVRQGGLRLDRVVMDVPEELETTVAVRRLSMAMLAWLPSVAEVTGGSCATKPAIRAAVSPLGGQQGLAGVARVVVGLYQAAAWRGLREPGQWPERPSGLPGGGTKRPRTPGGTSRSTVSSSLSSCHMMEARPIGCRSGRGRA